MLDHVDPRIQYAAGFFASALYLYMLCAGLFVLLLWMGSRWTARRKIQARPATWKDRRREIGNSAMAVLMYTLVMLVTYELLDFGYIRAWDDTPVLWIGLIELVLVAIAHDAYFYWTHRLLHTRAMFRRAHATHHQSRAPTSFAAYSFSPIEGIVQAGFVPVILIFTPLHTLVIFGFMVHEIIRNAIGHSGYELTWPGFSRSRWTGWMTTTTHHDLHHSEGAHNFGLYFTWWDRWMGTEHPRYHERFEAAAKPWFGRPAPLPEAAEEEPAAA